MDGDYLAQMLEREFSEAKEFRDKTGERLRKLELWTAAQDERAASNKRWRNYLLTAVGLVLTIVPIILAAT